MNAACHGVWSRETRLQEWIGFLFAVLVALCLALTIGYRGEGVGSDTPVYSEIYRQLVGNEQPSYHFEFLYDLLAAAFAALEAPVGLFLAFVSVIGFVLLGITAAATARFMDRDAEFAKLLLITMSCLFVSPIFASAEINVIRQGVSAFGVICFYMLLLARVPVVALVTVGAIAAGFHYTALLYLVLSLLLFLPAVWFFLPVAAACVAYVVGASEVLVRAVSEFTTFDVYSRIMEYGRGYAYETGTRLDFAAFTVVVGVSFAVAGHVFLSGRFRKRFFEVLRVYWILVLPFFAFGFGAFSDRYLFNGWLFLSLLMAVTILGIRGTKSVPTLVVALMGGVTAAYFVMFQLG